VKFKVITNPSLQSRLGEEVGMIKDTNNGYFGV